jgi:hypothetical protein
MIFYQESYDGVQGLRYFATSGTNQLPGLQQPLLVYPGSVLGTGPIIIPTQVSTWHIFCMAFNVIHTSVPATDIPFLSFITTLISNLR